MELFLFHRKGTPLKIAPEKNPTSQKENRWPWQRPVYVAVMAWMVLALACPQSAQAQGNWSETGPLNIPRFLHTATLMNNYYVLVAGGRNAAGTPLNSAERFDPYRGRWSNTNSLDTGRYFHTATTLSDQRVLVAGGLAAGGTIASAELFSPTTYTWSPTGAMTTARRNHTATLLANGNVLVTGGYNGADLLGSVEVYNCLAGTWNSINPLVMPRRDHTATRLSNHNILVVGGEGEGGLHPSLASAELLNTATAHWSGTGSLNQARRNHTATLLKDGRVLVVGGWGNSFPQVLDSAEIYDPASGTWSSVNSLHEARYGHTAALLDDGRVLVAAGIGTSNTALSSTEIFNPVTGTWRSSSLGDSRHGHAAALLGDGRVLVASGNGLSSVLTSATIFDPLSSIQNASFERATMDPGDSYIRLADGSNVIFRWNVVEGNVDYRGDWQVAEGEFCVDLNGSSPGAIAQIITTSSGGRYLVTFSMAGHTGGAPAIKTLRVSVGTQSQTFSFDTTGKDIGNMGWTTKSWFFTTSEGVNVIKFESLTSGPYGPALDNVRVIQIPSDISPILLLLD